MDVTEGICVCVEYIIISIVMIAEIILIARQNTRRLHGFYLFTAAVGFSLIGVSLGLNVADLFVTNIESPIISVIITIPCVVFGCAATYAAYMVIVYAISFIISAIKKLSGRK